MYNETIAVLASYRPLNQNINTFSNELEIVINKVNKKRECILVGDINIDITKQNKTTTA